MISDKPDEFAWPEMRLPPARVSEAIHRTCTKDLAQRKPHNAVRRVLLSILVSGSLFTGLLTIGWMRHPPKNAEVVVILGALAWGLMQAWLLFLGHAKPPGRRRTRIVRWIAVLTVPTIFIVHLILSSGSVLSFRDFLEVPRSLHRTAVCGFHALLFGAGASLVLFLLWSRTDPYNPRLTGALTGLAGGLVGAVALDMVCVNDEGWHLWLGHGLTLLVFIVGGWFAGRRWISP